MTIHQTNSNVTYFGDGAQTVFNYNFRIFQNENLNVYVDEVLQAYVTDYDVTNNGDETGGNVIFTVPPANGAVILIDRVLADQQLLDLIEYDRFPAESVEAALDYIVLLIQQNAAAIARSVSTVIGSPVEGLEFPAAGAGEFIKYTDDGLALETADLHDISSTIISSATDGEIIAGTQTDDRLISPAQVKLGVETHETVPITSVFNVAWVEVVAALPGTPDADTLYLVRE